MSELGKLAALAKRMPWWGWAGVGGAGLGAVVYFRKAGASKAGTDVASSPTGAQPMYQPPDGLSSGDLAGLPFDSYDWSASGAPYDQPAPSGAPDQPPMPPDQQPPFPEMPPTPAPLPPAQRPPAPSPSPSGVPTAPGMPLPGGMPTPGPGKLPPPGSTPPMPPQRMPPVWFHEVHAAPAWDSTLSGIAEHYGMGWQALYNFGNDHSIIDSAAHAHGHYGDEYNWLFPGEMLQVPSPN